MFADDRDPFLQFLQLGATLDSVSGDISSVSLAVAGARLLVVAGEVEGQWSGRLDFVLDDESVLVFTDPTAAETVPWRNPSSIRSPRPYDRSTTPDGSSRARPAAPTGEQIDWYGAAAALAVSLRIVMATACRRR